MVNRALHKRWVIFAKHLMSGHSATDAYLEAGYRCTNRASAQAAASRLRKHPDVKAYLQHLDALATRQAYENALRLRRQNCDQNIQKILSKLIFS